MRLWDSVYTAAQAEAHKAELLEIWKLGEQSCPIEAKRCAQDKSCATELDALVLSNVGPPTPRNSKELYGFYVCVSRKQTCVHSCFGGNSDKENFKEEDAKRMTACQKRCGWYFPEEKAPAVGCVCKNGKALRGLARLQL